MCNSDETIETPAVFWADAGLLHLGSTIDGATFPLPRFNLICSLTEPCPDVATVCVSIGQTHDSQTCSLVQIQSGFQSIPEVLQEVWR